MNKFYNNRRQPERNEKAVEPMQNKMFGMPGGIMETYSYPAPVMDHVIYIDDLEDLQDHLSRLQLIRMLQPDDSVRIIINSPGGAVNIAMAYLQAMRESQGHVVTHAEGMVCSAGTILWLGAKEHTLSPNCEFMFHNYQGGTFGDGANMHDQVTFFKRHFDRLIDKMYTGVLTEEEIAKIKGGGQVWLNEEEIAERTGAIILDEENIARIQAGQQALPFNKDRGVLGEEGLPEVHQCNSMEELVKAIHEAKAKDKEEDHPKDVYLNLLMDDGRNFKLNVATLSEEELKDFTVAELREILVQLHGALTGEEIEVKDNNRGRLVKKIIKTGKDLHDKLLG